MKSITSIALAAFLSSTAAFAQSPGQLYAEAAYECVKRPSVAQYGGFIKDKGPQARPRLVISFPNDNPATRKIAEECHQEGLVAARGDEWKPSK